MNIGIGICWMQTMKSTASVSRTDDWARVCCSLYILDCTYGPCSGRVRSFTEKYILPVYRQRIGTPAPNNPEQDQLKSPEIQEENRKIDIETAFHAMMAVWVHTMDFVQHAKNNADYQAWRGAGPYQKVVQELYKFERRIGHAHRIRDMRPDLCPQDKLQRDRSYWILWISMQVLYHATQVVLHHPFLHIVRTRHPGNFQPPTFLQHVIDQSLLHAGWTVKLIELSVEKQLVLNDPFLTHLVAAVATCYLFFVRAQNTALSNEALQNLATCYDWVFKFSAHWPHIRNTVSEIQFHRCYQTCERLTLHFRSTNLSS